MQNQSAEEKGMADTSQYNEINAENIQEFMYVFLSTFISHFSFPVAPYRGYITPLKACK